MVLEVRRLKILPKKDDEREKYPRPSKIKEALGRLTSKRKVGKRAGVPGKTKGTLKESRVRTIKKGIAAQHQDKKGTAGKKSFQDSSGCNPWEAAASTTDRDTSPIHYLDGNKGEPTGIHLTNTLLRREKIERGRLVRPEVLKMGGSNMILLY